MADSTSSLYSSKDHPEHLPWISTAVETMLDILQGAGSAGVPLTLLLERGIESVPGDTGPRSHGLEFPGTNNLYVAVGLPIWGLAVWGHLMDRCRDQISVHSGNVALLAHLVDGAPLIKMPVADTCRSYAKDHWLPMLVTWTG